MIRAISKMDNNAVKVEYLDGAIEFLDDLTNIRMRIVYAGVDKQPNIYISYAGNVLNIPFDTLETIAGQPKPADINDAMELIAESVFNFGGGSGGGGAVAWGDISGKPAVIGAGATAAAARNAIGAGTSNLALGTSATTALAGDTEIPPAPTEQSILDLLGIDQIIKTIVGNIVTQDENGNVTVNIPIGTDREVLLFISGVLSAGRLGWAQFSDLPTPPNFSNGVLTGTAFQQDGSALFAFLELALGALNESIVKPNAIPFYNPGQIGTGGGTLPVADAMENGDAVNLGQIKPFALAGSTIVVAQGASALAARAAIGAASATTVARTITASGALVVGDINSIVATSVAAGNVLTVPTNAAVALPVGSLITIIQKGAGQTTITPSATVTINSAGGRMKLTGQYSAATLYKESTNVWLLFGDLSA